MSKKTAPVRDAWRAVRTTTDANSRYQWALAIEPFTALWICHRLATRDEPGGGAHELLQDDQPVCLQRDEGL